MFFLNYGAWPIRQEVPLLPLGFGGRDCRAEEKGCVHKIQAEMYISKGFIDWVVFDNGQHFSSINIRN